MAFGTLKCDTIENDNSQSITVASLVSLDTSKANLSGATFTGDVVLDNESELRLSENDNNGSNFISLKSPAAVGTNSTWTLPSDAPAAGEVLKVSSVSSNNPTLEWGAGGIIKKILNFENNTRASGSGSADTDVLTYATSAQFEDHANNDILCMLTLQATSLGNNYHAHGLSFLGNTGTRNNFYNHGTAAGGNTGISIPFVQTLIIPAGTLTGSTFTITLRTATASTQFSILNPNTSDDSRMNPGAKSTLVMMELAT